CVGLTTLRGHRKPLWLGSGLTQTQYATHFVRVHENVCRILDLARGEKLLYKGHDTCGYFKHRDWARSADLVNRETLGAWAVSKLLAREVEAAQQAGAKIDIVRMPALQTVNIVRVDPPREEAARPRRER